LKAILVTSPVYSAADENGLVRLDDAETVQIDWEIGFFRLRDGDWNGRLLL